MALFLARLIIQSVLIYVAFRLVLYHWDVAIRHSSLGPSRGAIPELDPVQLSCLHRGSEGVIETVLATLVRQGHLMVDVEQRLVIPGNQLPMGLTNLEKQVMRAIRQGANLRQLYQKAALSEDVKRSLRSLNLLPSKDCGLLWKWSPIAFVVLGCGFFVLFFLFHLILLDHSIAVFIIIGLLSIVVGFVSALILPHVERTRWGDVVLKHYRQHHDPTDPIVCVALNGHSAMSDGGLDALERLCSKYYRDHVYE